MGRHTLACFGLGTSGRRYAARFALSQKTLLGPKKTTMRPLASLLLMEGVGNEIVLDGNRGLCEKQRRLLGLLKGSLSIREYI
jgi:hypothetical protein